MEIERRKPIPHGSVDTPIPWRVKDLSGEFPDYSESECTVSIKNAKTGAVIAAAAPCVGLPDGYIEYRWPNGALPVGMYYFELSIVPFGGSNWTDDKWDEVTITPRL